MPKSQYNGLIFNFVDGLKFINVQGAGWPLVLGQLNVVEQAL